MNQTLEGESNVLTNPEYLNSSQYRTAANLRARMELHGRFSTNPADWFRWVYDHFNLPPQARILEAGCGNGNFWLRNRERISPGWEIFLTDQSEGMIADARRTLRDLNNQFTFEQIDVQNLPYPDGYFDAVMANHMLYHVADRQKAFGEIQRVLKPHGKLFAATNGENHMVELDSLIFDFSPELARKIDLRFNARNFNLENGAEQMQSWFSCLEIYPYIDSLHVTEATPLASYICSMVDPESALQMGIRFEILEEFIRDRLKQRSPIVIQKSSGLFVALK